MSTNGAEGGSIERGGRRPGRLILLALLILLFILFLFLWWLFDAPYVCAGADPDGARLQPGAPADDGPPLAALEADSAVFAHNLVVVPRQDLDNALATLDAESGPFTAGGLPCAFDGDDVSSRYGLDGLEPDDAELAGRAVEAALGSSAIIAFDDRWNPLSLSDPVAVVNRLREDGIDARPVLAVAPEVHWKFQEGGEPHEPIEGQVEPENPACATEGDVVAIVDSGWSTTGAEAFDCVEAATTRGGASDDHGTFVAGLIRQIAPDAPIEVIGVAFDRSSDHDFTFSGHDHTGDIDMDELGVAVAIRMFALRDDRAYAALNLSLGTFGAIVGGEELPPVYLRQALDEWDTAGAPVLAAAGNSVVEGKAAFYPAAFEDVYGVAAIDLESTYTVWSGYGRNTRTTQDLPAWVYTRAPGVDLVSVVPAESPFVRWSGSSFATAVATGVTALCDLDQPPGELGYDEVPGLWSAEDPASPVLSAGSLECGGLR